MKSEEDRDYVYRSLFNNIPVGFYRTTIDGRIIEANNMLVQMLGYPDRETLLSVKVTDIFVEPSNRFEEHDTLAKQGVLRGYEIQLRRKDGSTIWVEDYTRAIKNEAGDIQYCEGSLIDIRDRKLLEEERLKAGKIELLRLLVDGIGHDFSNLLTIISGNTTLLKKSVPQEGRALKALSRIENACQEMTELINQFYKITEGGESAESTEFIQKRVPEILESFVNRSVVKFKIEIPDDLWPVKSTSTDLNQIIRNLIVNAQEAIQKKKDGIIDIAAQNITLAGNQIHPLRPGKYVKLAITDNGKGVLPENLSRIFDPYFSTKLRVTDKGRGLGLAIAQALAKKYGGDIKLTSEPEKGTTAEVYLPSP